jgi:1,2-phenylacetyl-CoA epoxidase catalytic subunit
MIYRLLLACLVMTASISASGCHFFGKKKAKTKESSAIASDTEQDFRQRWLAKRVGELTAKGVAPDQAQSQAEAEFDVQFKYIKKPSGK